ncbi:MAG: very short patch repair endonuclease [Acidobacteriota bacterium]|nr:very short patch repair endonuclease [Acidobacteriota bacterium]
MTPEQRFRAMSRVKLKDGSLETIIRSELHRRGYRFKKHVKTLPGSPDAVFPKEKIAVFIDGDFWHGYRFPAWEHKLKDFWKEKIKANRRRDQKNFRKLRRMGWRVIRLWQHDIKRDPESCIVRVIAAVTEARMASNDGLRDS